MESMGLSSLQHYIITTVWQHPKRQYPRAHLADFYTGKKGAPRPLLQTKIITRSLERLIDRELLVGYGVRTAKRWYIKDIALTPKGKRLAHTLYQQRQQRLPIKR